jgi:HK97 family phage prohead protease
VRRQSGFQLLEAADWNKRLRDSAPSGDLQSAADSLAQSFGLMKASIFDVRKASEDESDRTLEFTISTGSVDRDWDRVNPKGWDLRAYRKNPVVLWAHDHYGLPVARSQKVWTSEEKLDALAEFTPYDLNPFGDMVYRMLRGRYLRTASVGFRPLKLAPAEEEERRQRYGLDFDKQELLEWSVVPVPANSEALMRAHADGINTRPLKAWAERVLDLREPLPGLGLNDVESAWKAVKGADRLIVWVENEEPESAPPKVEEPAPEPEKGAAGDPDPVPRLDPPQYMTIEELARYGMGLVFRRRPQGDYEVLRNGEAVLVVENPDAVEWDADGVLRLAEAPDPDALLLDLEPETETPDAEPEILLEESEEAELLVELPAETTPQLSGADVMRALGEVLAEKLGTLMPARQQQTQR